MLTYDTRGDVAVVQRAARIDGTVDLPADKSIAHRAALFAALGDGTSKIIRYASAEDPQTTLSCLRRLGVLVHSDVDDDLIVEGRGLEGLARATGPLDCGNSGTTMRLLAGILAGQPFESVLEGDASLRVRPMERIARPLREMGARVTLTTGHAPIRIAGGRLRGITYHLPVPSAQVKSCVLLAGLYAEGVTSVVEDLPTRDHTERMLGLSAIEQDGARRIVVEKGHRIVARVWTVPRDFSAAAFFMVAGAAAPRGEVRMDKVGLNPTRAAFLDVLRAMGGRIYVSNESDDGGEPVGDLFVHPSELSGVTVRGDVVPILIDEIPILAVAGALATGRTEIRDARELRVKESDRIRAVVDNLRKLGAEVEEFEDGLAVEGPARLRGAELESYGDHRIAMAMAVAGLHAEGETVIRGASCAAVSFPSFWSELARIAQP